jgi:hypothetical protein
MLGGGGVLGGGVGALSGQQDWGDIATSALLGAAGVGAFGKTSGKLLGTEGGAKYIMGEGKFQSQTTRDLIRKLLASGAMNVGGSE